MTQEQQTQQNRRAGDGGIYLVISDDSAEFQTALRYALKMAQARRGHVAVARIIETQDFTHWGGVEARVAREQRREAEEKLWEIGRYACQLTDSIPGLYIHEGETIDVITNILEEDPNISMLVLGASESGHDRLITHFAAKHSSKLRVPVLIVPGHLDDAAIDSLA